MRSTSAKQPSDAAEVRSFLGLAAYCSRYIPDFETVAEPMRRLTRKGGTFKWGKEQEKAFVTLKKRLSSSQVLAYFNKTAHTQVIADASPVGLGAVLVQRQEDGNYRPVYYAARSLSEVERRYSQTEKEALSLVWACERFKLFLIGLEFELLTDHRPLEVIYGPKSKPSARIERWVLQMQPYAFTVKYIPGKHNIADVLSRLAEFQSPGKNTSDNYIRAVTVESVPKTMSAREIETESKTDEELEKIRECIATGDFSNAEIAYRVCKEELTTIDYIVLRQTRIVVPTSLRKEVVHLAHKGHQGIVKTKARLKGKSVVAKDGQRRGKFLQKVSWLSNCLTTKQPRTGHTNRASKCTMGRPSS